MLCSSGASKANRRPAALEVRAHGVGLGWLRHQLHEFRCCLGGAGDPLQVVNDPCDAPEQHAERTQYDREDFVYGALRDGEYEESERYLWDTRDNVECVHRDLPALLRCVRQELHEGLRLTPFIHRVF